MTFEINKSIKKVQVRCDHEIKIGKKSTGALLAKKSYVFNWVSVLFLIGYQFAWMTILIHKKRERLGFASVPCNLRVNQTKPLLGLVDFHGVLWACGSSCLLTCLQFLGTTAQDAF